MTPWDMNPNLKPPVPQWPKKMTFRLGALWRRAGQRQRNKQRNKQRDPSIHGAPSVRLLYFAFAVYFTLYLLFGLAGDLDTALGQMAAIPATAAA